MDTELKDLIGKKVKKLFLNKRYLKFETDGGNFVYEAVGDCCSYSYFYDFYGVKNLLENGAIKEIKWVKLHPTELFSTERDCDSLLQVYGFQIIAESDRYGDITSAFSFRNESNGYYGGCLIKKDEEVEVLPEITDDVHETKPD